MDINLNVPRSSTSNFLGNNSVTSLQTEKGEVFTEIFANLEEGDDSKNIDSNLLLTLLNNLQIKNVEDYKNTESDMEVIDEQGIDLNDTSNINNFYMDGELTAINPTTINSVDTNNAMVNFTENGVLRELNNEEYELVKKIEKSNSFIKNNDMNDTNHTGYKDIIEINLNGYDDLEISSLNNKNTIVKFSYMDKGDKELSTLESILNYEDISEIIETKNLKTEVSKIETLKIGNLESNKVDIEESNNLYTSLEKDMSEIMETKNSEIETLETEILESNKVDTEEELNNSYTNSKNDDFIFINNASSNNELHSIENNDSNVVSHVREEFLSEDIVKTVKYLKSNGMEEITIKISPRELGDMTIKLIKNGDETSVDITINKEDVFSLVNDNISEITKHLENLNISVKDVSVNIKSSNQNYFSDNFNQEFDRKNQQNHEKFNKKQIFNNEEDNDERENSKGESNLNILV